MNHILRPVIGKMCLVFGQHNRFFKTAEEHVEDLKVIFDLLDKANMRLKLEKCRFMQSSVDYLGHIIYVDGVSPSL
jgi:hypothetical protein